MDALISTDAANNLMLLAVAKKLLGPTADEMAEDIKKIYIAGRDAVFKAGARKVLNLDDGARTNFRITRDVLWDGAFSSEAISAEYFGGILAASRSTDGKDDSIIGFLNIIKSLSSSQLRLHYFIYTAFQKLLVNGQEAPNVGKESDLNRYKIFHGWLEVEKLGVSLDTDACFLHNHGLISGYAKNYEPIGYKNEEEFVLPYFWAIPTTLGVQLYMVVHNRFPEWREYSKLQMGDFPDVLLPEIHTFDLQKWVDEEKAKFPSLSR